MMINTESCHPPQSSKLSLLEHPLCILRSLSLPEGNQCSRLQCEFRLYIYSSSQIYLFCVWILTQCYLWRFILAVQKYVMVSYVCIILLSKQTTMYPTILKQINPFLYSEYCYFQHFCTVHLIYKLMHLFPLGERHKQCCKIHICK